MLKKRIYIIPFDYKQLKKINYLNQEEYKKSNKFQNTTDIKNYQLSHIYLRELLTKNYPDIAPQEWKFKYSGYKKPKIAIKRYENVHFNISHTKSHFAMIISNRECGIDIEEEKKSINRDIFEFILTPQEKRVMRQNNISFYTFWTLKEAYLKAIGKGLVVPPKTVELLSIPIGREFNFKSYKLYTDKIKPNLYLSYSYKNS